MQGKALLPGTFPKRTQHKPTPCNKSLLTRFHGDTHSSRTRHVPAVSGWGALDAERRHVPIKRRCCLRIIRAFSSAHCAATGIRAQSRHSDKPCEDSGTKEQLLKAKRKAVLPPHTMHAGDTTSQAMTSSFLQTQQPPCELPRGGSLSSPAQPRFHVTKDDDETVGGVYKEPRQLCLVPREGKPRPAVLMGTPGRVHPFSWAYPLTFLGTARPGAPGRSQPPGPPGTQTCSQPPTHTEGGEV